MTCNAKKVSKAPRQRSCSIVERLKTTTYSVVQHTTHNSRLRKEGREQATDPSRANAMLIANNTRSFLMDIVMAIGYLLLPPVHVPRVPTSPTSPYKYTLPSSLLSIPLILSSLNLAPSSLHLSSLLN